MYKGSMVALVTPMRRDGGIDLEALKALADWHVQAKTSAIIAVGTTGESATLDAAEKTLVISTLVKAVNGRLPIIAGTGTNATRSTIKLTEEALQAGADACLIVTPYYNKPTQQGLLEHYKAIAESTTLPIILYNVPGRTGCDLLPETIEQLSHFPNIIGIKEATGLIERAQEIKSRCPADFEIYSGDDPTALQLILHGARGVISVTTNVAPTLMQKMCEAALRGEIEKAAQINEQLMPLHRSLFVQSNPIPVKWALHEMGKIDLGIRLPLVPLDTRHHKEVKEALQNAGVLQ